MLTDGTNHPAAIADFLRRHGAAEDYALWVCENLGGADERVSRHAPGRHERGNFFAAERRGPAAGARSVSLAPVLRGEGSAVRGEADVPLLGIPEGALLHRTGPRGMITRREVRLLALCYLELRPGDVLWDIGAGSGSVAIEAARLSPRTCRSSPSSATTRRSRQLEANVARLGAGRVRAVHAEAPEGLADLPDPDAVFIGGSGGRLARNPRRGRVAG